MRNVAHEVDPALIDMMDAVFADYRKTHPPAARAERDPGLWGALNDLGLVRLTGAEDNGGSGADWHEAAELLSAAVRHGVRVPLAEHDLLACSVLEAAGQKADDDAVRTVCRLDQRGIAANVPWVSGADRVVIVWRDGEDYRLADIDADRLDTTDGGNAIGEPRHTVTADARARAEWDGTALAAAAVEKLRLKSAMVRAIQVCAALDKILELSIEHATSRIQFGRPLSKFQALQNLIADTACEAALARAATEAALSAAVKTGWDDPTLRFRVASARSCAGHAASLAVRNAHQIHGAIGTTREHRLHEYTRAALAWRSEFGSVRYWDQQVSEAALAAGSRGLWSMITA